MKPIVTHVRTQRHALDDLLRVRDKNVGNQAAGERASQ